MTFPDGWQKRAALVIQAGQVPDAQSDFPVPFTEGNLPADLFAEAQADGGDLRFSADEAGTTQLAAHVIRWEPGSPNVALIRVKVPNVSDSADTTIYVWAKTEATESQPAVTDTFGRNAVYSNDYAALWALEEDGDGTAGEYVDATGNGHDGQGGGGTVSRVPSRIDGQLGFGQDFTRADDQNINLGNDAGLDFTGNFTISGWIKPDLTDTAQIIYSRGSFNNHGIRFGATGVDSNIDLWTFQDGGNTRHIWPNPTPNDPIHIFMARDGANAMLLVDGQEVTPSVSDTLQDPVSSGSTAFIGGGGSSGTAENFDGLIDELRLAPVARTKEWGQTEYNAESDPAAFVVPGALEDVEPRQELTDFSEYPSDQAAADWSEHGAAGFAVVRDVAGVEGGKVLEWDHDTQERQALTWDEIAGAADAKVAIRRRRTDAGRVDLRPIVRGGANAADDQYHAQHDSDDNAITIGKTVGGTFTLLASATKALDVDDWIWIEIQVEGENLEARFWQDGAARPASPDLTATDSDLSSGSVGLFHFRTGRAEVDVFSVATKGENLLFPEPIEPGPEAPGPDGTRRRARLTINEENVDAALADFPVPLTEANIPADVFDFAQADGGDIRLTSDAEGENRLAVHLIRFAPGSPNAAIIRTKVPSVSDSEGAEIFLWCDAEATLSQPAPGEAFGQHAVYSNGYNAFWPLEESGDGTAAEFKDATANALHGQGGGGTASEVPARVDGQVGFGQEFVREDGQHIDCGDDARIRLTGDFTWSGWFRVESTAAIWLLSFAVWNTSGALMGVNDGELNFFTLQDGANQKSAGAGAISQNTWHHLAVVRQGASATLLVDGVDVTTESGTHQDPVQGNKNFFISEPWTGATLQGQGDEIRIVDGARSVAWLKAEYASENDPGAFVTPGSLTAVGATVVPLEQAVETNQAFEIGVSLAGASNVPIGRAEVSNVAFEITPRITAGWSQPVSATTLIDEEGLVDRNMNSDGARPFCVVEIDAFRIN